MIMQDGSRKRIPNVRERAQVTLGVHSRRPFTAQRLGLLKHRRRRFIDVGRIAVFAEEFLTSTRIFSRTVSLIVHSIEALRLTWSPTRER